MKRMCFASTLLLASALARPAFADDKAQCLDAYEKAQRVRQEGKLRESRTQLAVCSREVCPASIRKDCGRWLDDVEQGIPTIILRATGEQGEDLKEVSVAMDGEVIATSLTGGAVAIDPGSHKFEFRRAGKAPVTVEAVIAEGDKRRTVAMTAPRDTTTPTTTTERPVAEQPPPVTTERPTPILTYVLGGVAIVGLAGFGFFAYRGSSTRSDLDSCKPFCGQDEIDASKKNFVIGDVFLGVGVVALAAATVIYLTRPERTTNVAVLR